MLSRPVILSAFFKKPSSRSTLVWPRWRVTVVVVAAAVMVVTVDAAVVGTAVVVSDDDALLGPCS